MKWAVGPLGFNVVLRGFDAEATDTLDKRFGSSRFPVELRTAASLDLTIDTRPGLFWFGRDAVASDDGSWAMRHEFVAQRDRSGAWFLRTLPSTIGVEAGLRWIVSVELIARGGLLLHGSSIALDGRSHVFVGHSGAGKSTLAFRGDHDGILCDEVSIVCGDEEGTLWCYPSPFWGLHVMPRRHTFEPLPVHSIWLLAGWESSRTETVDDGEALLGIGARIVDIGAASGLSVQVLDRLTELLEYAETGRMRWQLGSSLRALLTDWVHKNDRNTHATL
ncbi:MAG: hypothetical protein KC561_04995 [Myxococcales bacterium]|nr:hypothetical protein [Myxococcales bacterium]